ncbi:DUF2516 family protein [Streptomyces sp. TRM 70351]|uniref:DUF2516 family protein n=1 Tax=Streptomyces sp. TRM 70351 TaxID=3116552 RepID=UPI002E7B5D01|nr:DUF2516 family protein [Streptomyces sp. TRM 70351]MEE1931380.1 DUF2516 family protein [Streptomyces sp. TRM 70351]
MILTGFNEAMDFLFLGLLVFSVFCFVDAILRREDAYRAADKNTKQFWLILLGIGAAINLFVGGGFLLLTIIAVIADIVYMVDVRPALIRVTGSGGGRYRGSSSDGPYGPYNGGR